jgi:penicillin-binding protein 1C
MQLARAYASLARGGLLPHLRTTDWIQTTSGDTLFSALPSSNPTVVDERVAYLITDILSDPKAREPAFGRGGPLELPFACATKTGTSKDYRDNVAVGYTPRHTVAVWAGNFDGSPMQRVSGISGAGPLMKAILLELGASGNFARPRGITDAIVCDDSGKLPGRFCRNLAIRPMRDHLTPSDTCDTHVTVVSDSRTGQIANSTTPLKYQTATNYLSLPPIYDAWMAENGFVRPPTESSRTAGKPRSIEVLFPMNGSVFQIDPVLRASYQRLSLKAAVSTEIVGAEWWIDGRRHASVNSEADWIVEPGWHSIEIRGISAAGDSIQSQTSRIFVGSTDGQAGPETNNAASNHRRSLDP